MNSTKWVSTTQSSKYEPAGNRRHEHSTETNNLKHYQSVNALQWTAVSILIKKTNKQSMDNKNNNNGNAGLQTIETSQQQRFKQIIWYKKHGMFDKTDSLQNIFSGCHAIITHLFFNITFSISIPQRKRFWWNSHQTDDGGAHPAKTEHIKSWWPTNNCNRKHFEIYGIG